MPLHIWLPWLLHLWPACSHWLDRPCDGSERIDLVCMTWCARPGARDLAGFLLPWHSCPAGSCPRDPFPLALVLHRLESCPWDSCPLDRACAMIPARCRMQQARRHKSPHMSTNASHCGTHAHTTKQARTRVAEQTRAGMSTKAAHCGTNKFACARTRLLRHTCTHARTRTHTHTHTHTHTWVCACSKASTLTQCWTNATNACAREPQISTLRSEQARSCGHVPACTQTAHMHKYPHTHSCTCFQSWI